MPASPPQTPVTHILVLGTGNSCRSQMANAYLQFFAGEKAAVYSAGIAPQTLNPIAVQVMAEDHIDISKHTPNQVNEHTGITFNYVITVCDNAQQNCPDFAATALRFHRNFPHPAHTSGTTDEVLEEFRHVREMIKLYSANFIAMHLKQL